MDKVKTKQPSPHDLGLGGGYEEETICEEWRDINGYNGLYKVSNLGEVKSLHRDKSIILKTVTGKHGYHRVSLSKNGVNKEYKVHSLVLESFKGRRPNGFDASHIDGDKDNNSYTNLLWESRSDNALRRVNHGTHVDNSGIKHGMSKLTEQDVKIIRSRHMVGVRSNSDLGKQFNVSRRTISDIINKKTWKHI